MHTYSEMEDSIRNSCWFFESVEKLRASCDRKVTHLKKRRECLMCGTPYYPRVAKTRCPNCGSDLKSAKKVMTCPDCGYKSSDLGCPKCRDTQHWKAVPKDTSYFEGKVIPRLDEVEKDNEKELIRLVQSHPIHEWTSRVRGMGETSVGRMLSCCDIERCTTLSKFYAHYGWGLFPDGTVQRKVKGQKINYDTHAQSISYLLAVSLERQRGKYFEFYEGWKAENLAKGLSEGQSTSRAFRDMVKLMLSHFYEVWRKGVGLPYAEPYAYTILRPPHDPATKITPEAMRDRQIKSR